MLPILLSVLATNLADNAVSAARCAFWRQMAKVF